MNDVGGELTCSLFRVPRYFAFFGYSSECKVL